MTVVKLLLQILLLYYLQLLLIIIFNDRSYISVSVLPAGKMEVKLRLKCNLFCCFRHPQWLFVVFTPSWFYFSYFSLLFLITTLYLYNRDMKLVHMKNYHCDAV